MKHETKALQSGNPLEYKPIPQLLLAFSVPAIISCLINSIYNIVDQIFIGQGVGYLGNAATTIAFPVMTIILAFGTLIGAGSSANAAISLGERRNRRAEIILNNAFALALVSGIILMAVGLLFLRPILSLFGATEASMPYAVDYTSIILLGTPFNLIGIVLSNLARTDGHPRLSMYGMMIGAGLNTILDPIYIFYFPLGCQGSSYRYHHLADYLSHHSDRLFPAGKQKSSAHEASPALDEICRPHRKPVSDTWRFLRNYPVCGVHHAGCFKQLSCPLRKSGGCRRRRHCSQRHGNRLENFHDSGFPGHRLRYRCPANPWL